MTEQVVLEVLPPICTYKAHATGVGLHLAETQLGMRWFVEVRTYEMSEDGEITGEDGKYLDTSFAIYPANRFGFPRDDVASAMKHFIRISELVDGGFMKGAPFPSNPRSTRRCVEEQERAEKKATETFLRVYDLPSSQEVE